MKFLIASDIHGSAYYCRKLVERFEKEAADRLILIGDLLYHGPRNDLPRDYAPKEVISMLNELRPKILCVRGNCDTEVDQMVLEFPILADYAVIECGSRLIYAAHGHKRGELTDFLSDGDILLCGHTHIPACDEGRFTYLNTGSVSIPKGGSKNSYMTLEDGVFVWRDLDGNEYMRYEV